MKNMKPIFLDDATRKQLELVLDNSSKFNDYHELKTLFNDPRIYLWRSQLPKVDSVGGQINRTVAYLSNKYNRDNENGLVLFLQVLAGHIDSGDSTHQQLHDLIARLNRLRQPVVEQDGNATMSPAKLMMEAEDALQQEDHDTAERLCHRVLSLVPDSFYATDARDVLAEIQKKREYQYVKQFWERGSDRFPRLWKRFQQRYPGYDPDALAVKMLLPAPFAWVEIPRGTVQVKDFPEPFMVEPFLLAKYPLTNAQYALFVDAGGYKEREWWTEAGWAQREKSGWIEPRYWDNSKWNGQTHPVVGVSWYEAVAYCNWLSAQTAQKIMLPTDAQWQFAAQGTDGRAYPWGNAWDGTKCNNDVKPDGLFKNLFKSLPEGHGKRTTPVTAYEGRGDSPFGVVDMVGNVWEWCVTEYESGLNELNGTNVRVLHGGSWLDSSPRYFRAAFRLRFDPYGWDNGRGFRLARS